MEPKRHRVDVYLAPGEMGVYSTPLNVKTLLGSCVALCMWDKTRGFGGLNHYLLPTPMRPAETGLRYGNVSCRELIEKMFSLGSTRKDLWVAVIGGGSPNGASGDMNVGRANAEIALVVLKEFGIAVNRQETGGAFGRKLLFNTGDGSLIVRRLNNNFAKTC